MNDLNEETPSTTAKSVASLPSKISLEAMDDDAIRTLINDGYKLLEQRKRDREKTVKEQIKQLAASEGIKVSFRENRKTTKRE